MDLRSEPLFFSGSKGALYGVYHSASTSVRHQHGVVIVPPMGQESVRCHKSLQKLASDLATLGFDVFRFDFSGTGNSEDAAECDLYSWMDDINSATEELSRRSAYRFCSVVGVRLGASLAMCLDREVELLVVWDPIGDGAVYLKDLEALHTQLCNSPLYFRRKPGRKARAQDELVGYAMSPEMCTSLAEFRLTAGARTLAREYHWIEANRTTSGARPDVLSLPGHPQVQTHRANVTCHWESIEHLEDMLIGQPATRLVIDCFKEWASERTRG